MARTIQSTGDTDSLALSWRQKVAVSIEELLANGIVANATGAWCFTPSVEPFVKKSKGCCR